MIRHLKKAKTLEERAVDDAGIRTTVAGILSDIEKRGDAAVRELSQKFDDYAPASFRLTDQDIEAAMTVFDLSEYGRDLVFVADVAGDALRFHPIVADARSDALADVLFAAGNNDVRTVLRGGLDPCRHQLC